MELTPWREAAQRTAHTLVVLLFGFGAFSIAMGDPPPPPPAQVWHLEPVTR